MRTTVHNIKGRIADFLADPLGIYVGRTGWYSLGPDDRKRLVAHDGDAIKGSRIRLVGGPWGNPLRIGRDGDRKEVLEKYRSWLFHQPAIIEAARRELRGKHLYCWCAPLRCHGDVLAEVVDSEPTKLETLFGVEVSR